MEPRKYLSAIFLSATLGCLSCNRTDNPSFQETKIGLEGKVSNTKELIDKLYFYRDLLPIEERILGIHVNGDTLKFPLIEFKLEDEYSLESFLESHRGSEVYIIENKPRYLVFSSDGKILKLERSNKRIKQAKKEEKIQSKGSDSPWYSSMKTSYPSRKRVNDFYDFYVSQVSEMLEDNKIEAMEVFTLVDRYDGLVSTTFKPYGYYNSTLFSHVNQIYDRPDGSWYIEIDWLERGNRLVDRRTYVVRPDRALRTVWLSR